MRGNILLILGLLGTLAFVVSGLLGYDGFLQEALRMHVLVGLCACLLLLFSQSWIVIYLLGVERATRRWRLARGAGAPPPPAPPADDAAAWNRRAPAAGVLAIAAGLGSFALGSASLARSAPGWLHHAAFYFAVAAQLTALGIERQALAATDRLIAAADRPLAGHAT